MKPAESDDLKTSCVDETKADDATLVKEASPITDKAQVKPSDAAAVEEKEPVTEDDAETTETVKKDDTKATETVKTDVFSPNADVETPSVSPSPVSQDKSKSTELNDANSSNAPADVTEDSEKKPELEPTTEKIVSPSTASDEKKDEKDVSEDSVEAFTEPVFADKKELAVQISDDELERELNEASNDVDEADSPVTPSETIEI
ncbi:unnamed protein product [Ambrosiozyma monospora]|uniref:Unnamed protein product n=1 Tax=Ambrosiozyma monospora TaxID=43982 RepID=A0ACB5UB79_AMBMO|nr:unnamed protein product [Ambrosiozyma monospora]